MNVALSSSKPAGVAGGLSRPEAGRHPQERPQAAHAAPGASSGPDAELLAACATFDALEREWLAAHAIGAHDMTKEDEALVECKRIEEAQTPHFRAIMDLPCTTLEGAQAVAASLVLWKQEALSTGSGDIGECLTTKLVRSVLAMPGEDQDADLIAAVREFCRLHDAFDASTVSAEQKRLGCEIADLGERIAGTRATTMAGLAARAVALGRDDPSHNFDHESAGSISCRMLEALLRDGAALAAPVTPHPDTALLALRPEFDRLKAEDDAINERTNLTDEELQSIGVELDKLCMRVVAMPPARTAEGARVQGSRRAGAARLRRLPRGCRRCDTGAAGGADRRQPSLTRSVPPAVTAEG